VVFVGLRVVVHVAELFLGIIVCIMALLAVLRHALHVEALLAVSQMIVIVTDGGRFLIII